MQMSEARQLRVFGSYRGMWSR